MIGFGIRAGANHVTIMSNPNQIGHLTSLALLGIAASALSSKGATVTGDVRLNHKSVMVI